jgi:3D (Asp-Asp-Asp) domain-containing protein
MVLLFLVNPTTVKAMGMTGLLNAPEMPELVAVDTLNSAPACINTSLPRLLPAEPAPARYTTVRTITAYSSTADQTDSTPFITANGMTVNDGIVAANWLKFGTRVRIPEYFGDKVFVVADRMNSRYDDRLDIWMPSRDEAINFGLRNLTVEVF